jgi:hypothetical protein
MIRGRSEVLRTSEIFSYSFSICGLMLGLTSFSASWKSAHVTSSASGLLLSAASPASLHSD